MYCTVQYTVVHYAIVSIGAHDLGFWVIKFPRFGNLMHTHTQSATSNALSPLDYSEHGYAVHIYWTHEMSILAGYCICGFEVFKNFYSVPMG